MNEVLVEMIEKSFSHIKEVQAKLQYLETNNKTEFFKQANVLFEKWSEYYYDGGYKNPAHSTRMKWIFSELSILEFPFIENLHNFLIHLNKYRNEIMHNHDPKLDLNKLKEKMLFELHEGFTKLFKLPINYVFTEENLKKDALSLYEKKKHILEKIPIETFLKEVTNEITKIEQTAHDRTVVENYDHQLLMMVSSVYIFLDIVPKAIIMGHNLTLRDSKGKGKIINENNTISDIVSVLNKPKCKSKVYF